MGSDLSEPSHQLNFVGVQAMTFRRLPGINSYTGMSGMKKGFLFWKLPVPFSSRLQGQGCSEQSIGGTSTTLPRSDHHIKPQDLKNHWTLSKGDFCSSFGLQRARLQQASPYLICLLLFKFDYSTNSGRALQVLVGPDTPNPWPALPISKPACPLEPELGLPFQILS